MRLLRRALGRRHRRTASFAAASLLGGAACTPAVTPPPPAPPPFVESELAPRADPRIEVVDLRELPTQDPSIVSVVGVVSNLGDEPTARLSIRVRALDAAETTVSEATAAPETEHVPARGTTRFQVLMRVGPEVVGYHAEALARWPAKTPDSE